MNTDEAVNKDVIATTVRILGWRLHLFLGIEKQNTH